MIELKNLSAGYDDKVILKDISVSFVPGQLTVLLGPNGSGKSTLMRTAAGIQDKLSGEVLADGVNTDELSPRLLAQKITYMAQSRPTPNISAFRMVLHGRFPYLSYPRKYRPEDYAIARKAMERADIYREADRFLPGLSGGQRQKVYLAMALCQDTETIFMDEPTTYLDVGHQLDVMDMARSLAAEGKAVVLVLHDLSHAMRYADRVLLMDSGSLVADGTPEEVFASRQIDRVFQIDFRRIMTESGWHYYYGRQ